MPFLRGLPTGLEPPTARHLAGDTAGMTRPEVSLLAGAVAVALITALIALSGDIKSLIIPSAGTGISNSAPSH